MDTDNCIVKMFENHTIEIYCEEIDNKKQYYFKASDLGRLVNMVNVRSSIQNYDEDEKIIRKTTSNGGTQNTIFLTSRGVYRLLYNSKKPLAKKFRKWVGDILDDIIFNESKDLQKKLDETETQFKFLQMKYNEEIKFKEDKNWLHFVTKDQVSFDKFEHKTNNVYIGSSEFEHQNNIEKIGSTSNIKRRESQLATGNASVNTFQMRNTYNVYSGMGLITEKYIQSIFKPLHIVSGKSTEHYLVHQKFADKVREGTVPTTVRNMVFGTRNFFGEKSILTLYNRNNPTRQADKYYTLANFKAANGTIVRTRSVGM